MGIPTNTYYKDTFKCKYIVFFHTLSPIINKIENKSNRTNAAHYTYK